MSPRKFEKNDVIVVIVVIAVIDCDNWDHMVSLVSSSNTPPQLSSLAFGNLSKFLPIVHMKILSPGSDLAPKL